MEMVPHPVLVYCHKPIDSTRFGENIQGESLSKQNLTAEHPHLDGGKQHRSVTLTHAT